MSLVEERVFEILKGRSGIDIRLRTLFSLF